MNKINFKTMAELKRQATNGRYMKGGYYGKHADEWRKIVGTQSNGVWLYDGENRSFFDFPKAGDCEITNGTLKVYERRARLGNNSDVPANIGFLVYGLKTGKYKESEIDYYTRQVAEYELGEEN